MENLLSESLAINDAVKQISNEIENILIRKIQNSKTYMAKEIDGIIKKGSFLINTKGKLSIDSLRVFFVIYLYDNEEKYYLDCRKRVIDLNCESDFEKGCIYLNLAAINGNLSRESYGSIEHEINHILQNSLGQKKNEDLYKNILFQFKNGTTEYKYIAYALYLTFNTEISSFAVQYYAFLKKNNIPLKNVFDDFPYDEGNPYLNFEEYGGYVLDNINYSNETELKQKFGISKNEIISRIKNADKRYRTKMAKAATKYRDELQEINDKKINENTNLCKTNKILRLNFMLGCYKLGITEEESIYF